VDGADATVLGLSEGCEVVTVADWVGPAVAAVLRVRRSGSRVGCAAHGAVFGARAPRAGGRWAGSANAVRATGGPLLVTPSGTRCRSANGAANPPTAVTACNRAPGVTPRRRTAADRW